jgi:hypothetical protein
MSTCARCSQSFYYDPKHHRCPGDWEATVTPLPAGPYAGMSWVEECMAKQHGGADTI